MDSAADRNGKTLRQLRRILSVLPERTANRTCRRLHFVGSTLALACLAALLVTGNFLFLLAGLLCGYGLAWIGHFVFEKNRPASFRQPLYSFMGDWAMYWRILTGKIPF